MSIKIHHYRDDKDLCNLFLTYNKDSSMTWGQRTVVLSPSSHDTKEPHSEKSVKCFYECVTF